uniref:Uncharacterized protein n=1 Tax=Anguilla anguilla TaxID=7936 RepID=A0A0E9W873_ANGAN
MVGPPFHPTQLCWLEDARVRSLCMDFILFLLFCFLVKR